MIVMDFCDLFISTCLPWKKYNNNFQMSEVDTNVSKLSNT